MADRTAFFFFLAQVRSELDLAQLYSFEYSGKSAPLADTVRRASCWRWMIDLRRIILHGYLGYAAPRNIIDVNSRKATARGHKENVETRYRVASTRFSGFPPVNLPRFVAASLAVDTLVTLRIKCLKKKKNGRIFVDVYFVPLTVCFFEILFRTFRSLPASKSPFFQKPF